MKKPARRGLALALALALTLGLVPALAASKPVAINEKNFPDTAFRKYVKQFDANKDGKLDAAEIKDVDEIDVEGKKAVKNLKGIEYFTALEELDCSGTSVKTLDLRKNTAPWFIDVSNTPLTSLKLGRKTKLDELYLSGTNLASVDISGCPRQLECVTDRAWPYTVSKGVISWDGKDPPLEINTTTKVMNGKKQLFTYDKPKTFKFTKASVTLKRGEDYDVGLWALLKRTPAASVYATTFTCDKKGIIALNKHTGYAEVLKKGAVTVTAKSGGKTASIRVIVK